MVSSTKVTCPNCNHKFLVEDVLSREIEEKIRTEFEAKQADVQKSLTARETQLSERESQIEKVIEEKLQIQSGLLSEQIQHKYEDEFQGRLQTLNDENEKKSNRIKELLRASTENEQLKRKLSEREEELRLEYETKVTDQLRAETEKISRREKEKCELKFKEKDVLIEQLRTRLVESQQKIDQGSIQFQGEVQELAIEELLQELYSPPDEIKEIKKGQKGADILHEVYDASGSICGKIYYESKRTKRFSNSWIEKFKEDNSKVMADICILVTQSLPDGLEKVGQKEGVWICTYQDVKWLSLVLRDAILRLHSSAITQTNKGEKMQMLYDYLTSNEFKINFEAIVKGYKSLQDSYNDERLKMQALWKEREKQLEKILRNMVEFYGSIKGIASGSIPEISLLESKQPLLDTPEEVV